MYNSSAITFFGCVDDKAEDALYANFVQECTGETVNNLYVIMGSDMNRVYGLTGSNAYLNLRILSIVYHNSGSLITKRFKVGARWFDDVVNNDVKRENAKS